MPEVKNFKVRSGIHVSPNLSSFFLILFKSLFPLTPPVPFSQAGSRRTHHGEGDNVLL